MVNKINPYKVEAIKNTSEIIKRKFVSIPETLATKKNFKEPQKPFSVYLEAAIQRIHSRNNELKELKMALNNPKLNREEIKQTISSLNRGNIEDRTFLKSNGIKDPSLLGQHFDLFA